MKKVQIENLIIKYILFHLKKRYTLIGVWTFACITYRWFLATFLWKIQRKRKNYESTMFLKIGPSLFVELYLSF